MALYADFINVYHFMPLGGKVERDAWEEGSGNTTPKADVYTGKMTVSLKCRTELFTPDSNADYDKDKRNETPDFFTYDGENPVIPGSSLRGMLRNVYETITNSCLSVIDMDDIPVRRTSEVYLPGLLGWDDSGTISLFETVKYTVESYKRPDKNKWDDQDCFQEGAEVEFTESTNDVKKLVNAIRKKSTESLAKKSKWKIGYYFKGEPGVKKRHPCNAYVFLKGEDLSLVKDDLNPDSPELLQLKAVLESYAELAEENKNMNNHQGYKQYTKNLQKFLDHGTGYFPVHYSIEAGHIYLSPACITKEVYYQTMADILKKQEEHQSCNSAKRLCPACRLFGMTGMDHTAWSSSVRVQDAVLKKEKPEDIFWEEVTLMELASPKKSSTEFYLQKPESKGEEVLSWTYDYYMAKKDGTYQVSAYTPRISGRKFYWHQSLAKLPKEFIEKTKRNRYAKPIKKDVEFTFPVYFEKITKKQLDQLIWICNISAQKVGNRAKYGYKLGHGKPLGLGSVELTVEDVQLRCLKMGDHICYHLETYKDLFKRPYEEITYEAAGFDKSLKGAFLRMCDFGAAKKIPVTYPVAEYQSVYLANNGYMWFSNNHCKVPDKGGSLENGKITKRKELVFDQHMVPLTADSDITLSVNRQLKYSSGKEAKANDNYPAPGSTMHAIVKPVKENDPVVAIAQTETVDPFEITIDDPQKKYKGGEKIFVKLTKVYPDKKKYQGKFRNIYIGKEVHESEKYQ